MAPWSARVAVGGVLAALAGPVHADGAPAAPHANAGFELLGGSDALSAGLRVHLGADLAVGEGRVRPSLGLGATLGSAWLSVDDPRALDGSVTLDQLDYGPEVQAGLRWVNGGIVDTRVFASFAYLRTYLDDRLQLDPIDGVSGRAGYRASLGVNYADAVAALARRPSGDGRKADELIGMLMFLLPQQVEATWQRSAGSDRVGVTFSWGI